MPCLSKRSSRRPVSARSVSSSMVAAKNASLGNMPSGRRSARFLKKSLDGYVHELVSAGVAVSVQHHFLEEAFVDGFL